MVNPWVAHEMTGLDLQDKRLNKRLEEVLSQLGDQPAASIPAACGGWAETTGAYRLFDNRRVTFDKVLLPHLEATRERTAGQKTVVLIQDTTEIDLTRPHQQVDGAGPLDDGARRGVLLHEMHAFTPDGTALGSVRAVAWSRPEAVPGRPSRTSQRKTIPIEEKESHRWIEGIRQASLEAQRAPQTQFIVAADSEADIYELLVQAQARPANLDWVVRACQDRALADGKAPQSGNPPQAQAASGRMRERVLSEPVRLTQTLHVRGREAKVRCEDRGRRQPRRSRTAEAEVRAARVTLRPPWRTDRTLPEVAVNVVLVREIDPPADDVAVEWMLLTSLPIDSARQVAQVIQSYCVRWMIEILFRTLKSGCRIEQRRFEEVGRQLTCLAVYLIVAWRTLYVCRRARATPDINCEAIFEPAEWKAAYHVVHSHAPPPTPPTLAAMVAMVAQLGGYVNRKRKAPPGPQTIWLGLQRLHDLALCWRLFGPDARKGSP